MRYIVRVGPREHEVTLDGEGVHIDGDDVSARVVPIEGTPVQMVTIGDQVHRVVVRRGKARGTYTLWLDGYRFDVEALDERTRAIRELSRTPASSMGPAPIVAPMPGLIVRVNVQVGDRVQPGEGVVVMEAMKMENELRSQSAGTVKNVVVAAGATVEKGALLLELE
jgi:acetyl/propionyl-CoA carboxylase alpha subunit